ncbi:Switch-associated protein 70 [Eumeta japonica]|uniref:Switch-associated protein 70 n=1 Tax=Eumeta variegata TaxID=151549 RepID=A0A4C1W4P9_EUMVA|nr:Switch-associated protein 70 [Eumeta japonica]
MPPDHCLNLTNEFYLPDRKATDNQSTRRVGAVAADSLVCRNRLDRSLRAILLHDRGSERRATASRGSRGACGGRFVREARCQVQIVAYVLTANIGTLLDLYGVEKGLDHFKSSQELSFDEFRYYLQQEVFGSMPKTSALSALREYENKISECDEDGDNRYQGNRISVELFKVFNKNQAVTCRYQKATSSATNFPPADSPTWTWEGVPLSLNGKTSLIFEGKPSGKVIKSKQSLPPRHRLQRTHHCIASLLFGNRISNGRMREDSRSPELSLFEQKATARSASSHPYSVNVWISPVQVANFCPAAKLVMSEGHRTPSGSRRGLSTAETSEPTMKTCIGSPFTKRPFLLKSVPPFCVKWPLALVPDVALRRRYRLWVCWLVCRKNLLQREKPVFQDDSIFKLFRIFCLLADLVKEKEESSSYVVVLQPSEAGIVAEQLVLCLGLRWDAADWDALSSSIGHFNWAAFLTVLEAKYCIEQNLHKAALMEAVDELYNVFIEDIIKKGYLLKRGYLLPTMREYWCVLQPCALTYYKSSSQREQCGRIVIDEYCSVEPSSGDGKIQKFQVITPERTFEFGTQDHKTRLQWVSALRQAAALSASAEGYQQCARARRRGADARREREAMEARARLQQEVRARRAAEAQAQELAELAQQDNKKLEELKNAQTTLERLLQEETQAKRDEEIVRALQARVLTEEWERREELERLQEEQNRMLEEERLKRKQFEMLQAEKEAQFRGKNLQNFILYMFLFLLYD